MNTAGYKKKFVTKVILYYNFSSPYSCCNSSKVEEIWFLSQFRHCSIHYTSRKAHFKVAKKEAHGRCKRRKKTIFRVFSSSSDIVSSMIVGIKGRGRDECMYKNKD